MIPIAATIALSVAIGIGAERRFGERARRAARGALTGMLFTLVPFIAFFNIARWTYMPRGGHYSAIEEPELLAEEIGEFFRPLRRAT